MTTTIYPGGLSGSTVYTGSDQIITGKKTFLSGSAANVPLTIKGAASQTGNLTEWQDNSGNVLARIAANGDVYSGAVKLSGGAVSPVSLTANSATERPLLVKGAASQSVNLQEWQNSAGTVLSSVDSNGKLHGLTVRVPHTYAFSGSSLATTGAQPRFFVPLPTGQTASLTQAVFFADSGSATVSIEQWNGSAWVGVTGFTGLASGSSTSGSVALTAYATGTTGYTALRANFTAVTSPVNLTLTLFIDYTV